MQEESFEVQYTQEGERLDKVLSEIYPDFSRSFFQKLIKNSSKQNILTRKTPNQYNCSGVFLFLLLLCKFFFCKSCKCCETFFIIYCKLSKHLSVNINVCQF